MVTVVRYGVSTSIVSFLYIAKDHSFDRCGSSTPLLTGDTTLVLTGSADNSAKLWNCERGVELATFTTSSAVRTCAFSNSGNLFTYTTDTTMNSLCQIVLCDIRTKEAIK